MSSGRIEKWCARKSASSEVEDDYRLYTQAKFVVLDSRFRLGLWESTGREGQIKEWMKRGEGSERPASKISRGQRPGEN
ncbi:uncharacterized protein SPSK_08208 [Sporothrix schenckii 1099-18]|uniref:Uncharacterized protein n=1 Tax=Sporothrix schenckii 1099-18 TaxID=1397361 RepID=A0A0F2MIC6_SPOSC|nr:uncharacterized protein SPSK_08208 [Sporothrix schenckii 1099-18]KJR88819.1 hypothetical protein SPSK_08208 [Sporothrix schenckii 1099-18]